MFSEMFPQNSDRVERQKKAPLRVIIGNPPYSVGQKSENDNAKNQEYLKLDKKIASTYVASSNTTMNKALYDAYIKAFRWSSDRLDENGGIICFVSNGAWIDGNSTSGFRKSLEKEFSSIYVFNLRGNARTSGELRQKEAGNVFGSGSRTPISITLLVKNPKAKNEKAIINYYDIGDYLSREEKLTIISNFKSGGGDTFPWKQLIPNKEGDWISQRNNLFETFIPIASKDKKENCFFNINTNGVVTSRDAWVCNFSKEELSSKMKSTIDFYNSHLLDFQTEKIKNIDINLEEYIDTDAKKISWSRALKQAFNSGKKREFYDSSIVKSSYRPFIKEFFYFNRDFNECVYQQPTLYPSNSSKNIVINAIGLGSSKEYSTLISDSVLSYDFLEKAQCFPLYFYEENNTTQKGLFDEGSSSEYIRRDGVSDFILERAKKQYGKNVTKEDVFYYVYGFLHSPEYRETFANDLKKMLPRLPLVEDVRDFWAFSKAGRQLAELHLNYETVPAYEGVNLTPALSKGEGAEAGQYRVTKMRFPKKDQKDTIIYNGIFTIENIPAKAYEYVVNGKSAIEWIMERYQVTVHKDSGIKNDPNDWSNEVGNPSYIFDLLLSVINVSVQTVDIVEGLPKVRFE
jgi:predicted helicase